MAPDGIRRSFTGEGDWRMLPLTGEPREPAAPDAGSVLPFTTWPFAAVLSAVVEFEDVERLCLFRYEVDESERGSAGRWEATGESGLGSMYEWLRLRMGLLVLEEAGDRWVGGV